METGAVSALAEQNAAPFADGTRPQAWDGFTWTHTLASAACLLFRGGERQAEGKGVPNIHSSEGAELWRSAPRPIPVTCCLHLPLRPLLRPHPL